MRSLSRRGWRVFGAVAASVAAVMVAARAEAAEVGDGRYFGARLTAGGGAFYYPQRVDGGYYINGVPYDLTWYGAQVLVLGELYAFVPGYPRLSAGVAAAYFLGLSPKAMASTYSATADANGNGKGGFGGGSASFWLGHKGRLSLLVGYGSVGVREYYGGSGPVASVGAAFVKPFGDAFGELGVRFALMHLEHEGDGDVRGEQGEYMIIQVEGALDWAPTWESDTTR